MRKVASFTAIVVGVAMAIAGVITWIVVSNTLSGPGSAPSLTMPTASRATT